MYVSAESCGQAESIRQLAGNWPWALSGSAALAAVARPFRSTTKRYTVIVIKHVLVPDVRNMNWCI